MGLRTDLALESAQALETAKGEGYAGISRKEYEEAGCKITQIIVETEDAAQALGKPIGEYVTIETQSGHSLDTFPESLDEQVDLIAKEITRLSDAKGEALVIGLGNDDITPDALGPLVAKQIFATRHISKELSEFEEFKKLRSVAVLAPGVLGKTGIEVAEIVRAVCDKTKPSVVVAVDALACSEVSRLGCTIQLSNTGISPGSGVKNSRKELSKATLNAPVIAVGVPTVVDMHTIVESITGNEYIKSDFNDMMVTPRSIDKLIDHTAKLISMGINRAFQPDMSIEEITSLI